MLGFVLRAVFNAYQHVHREVVVAWETTKVRYVDPSAPDGYCSWGDPIDDHDGDADDHASDGGWTIVDVLDPDDDEEDDD